MFTSKKQVLLTFTLTLCSLGLTASQAEQETKSIDQALQAALPSLHQGPRTIIKEYLEEPRPYEEIATLNKPGSVLAFGINKDGTTLTSAGFIGNTSTVSVVRYNMNDRSVINELTLEQPTNYGTLLLSGDGKTLISNEDVFDTTTGKIIRTVPVVTRGTKNYTPVLLNYDGTMLAFQLQYEETRTPFILHNFETSNNQDISLTERSARKYAFPRFSRNSNIFAYLSNVGILLFDTKNGSRISQPIDVKWPFDLKSFDLNYDGSRVVYGADHKTWNSFPSQLMLFDVATKTRQKIYETPASASDPSSDSRGELILNVGFSETANTVYALLLPSFRSNKPLQNWIQCWNLETGKEIDSLHLDSPIRPTIAFNHNDRFLALGYSDAIKILKKQTESEQTQSELERKRQSNLALEDARDQERLARERLFSAGLPGAITHHIATSSKGSFINWQKNWLKQKKARTAQQTAPGDVDAGIFARQALRPSLSSANVFYQAAAKQAQQKKLPEHLRPAVVESLELDMDTPD